MNNINQRKIAYNIIYRTISDDSFTNLLLRNQLSNIPKIKRPFITNLVYGVLKNYDLLVYQTENLYKKANIKNKILLSMAVYELEYLKKEKYIVINEYVNLANSKFDKGFINATLHQYNEFHKSNDEYINHSIPEWIYNLLSKQYSNEELNIILNNYHRVPETYYQINPNKCSMSSLNKYNINIIDEYTFTSNDNLLETDEFKKGMFYVQDINAKELIERLNLNKNDIFLDGCSAPGSKLFNALKYIEDKNAYANDINETRVNLIKDRALLLGYKNIHFYNIDARNLHNINVMFDKILIDVPCSGIGVIGRRPDIKFHIKPESLDELENIQKDILESASKIIKKDGYILYSTCTLNKKENSKQINKFLDNHDNFKLLEELTILKEEGDLFYFALLKRI